VLTSLAWKPGVDFAEGQGKTIRDNGIEFRRGSAGGGNQLRQPYLTGIVPDGHYKDFPEVEHIHIFGYYIGKTIRPFRHRAH
jgi:CDP-6-deoxy-D-xylo-4-hexulose-3-dehydrase